jgi:transcriptional regulator GlxA family with amidase domain
MRKTVAILVFDEVEVLDFAGPFEVFSVTDELRDCSAFNVVTVAPRAGVVRARNGLNIVPHYELETCPPSNVLVVPGGLGTRALLGNPVVIEWIQQRARDAEATMSICTGAILLAKAELLEGLRVTTHHDLLDALRGLAPGAIVDPGSRYHDNGAILTSAGISAGIDCSLHLVGRLLGDAASSETAAYMEYERRSGR